MRYQKANAVLAGVFVLFLVLWMLARVYPDQALLRAALITAEAALVGGVADWFAVTALFRKPLGFPWHTALVPRNRDRVTRAVIQMIERDLLSADIIRAKLAQVRLIDILIAWLDQPGVLAFLEERLADYLQNWKSDRLYQKTLRFLEKPLKRQLRDKPLAGKVTVWLKGFLTDGREAPWVELAIEALRRWNDSPAALAQIRRYVDDQVAAKRSGGGLLADLFLSTVVLADAFNPADAAAAIQQQAGQLLREMGDEAHPMRQTLRQLLIDKVEQLDEDPVWNAAVEAWKVTLIDALSIGGALATLVPEGEDDRRLKDKLELLWVQIKGDQALLDWLEGHLQATVALLIAANHHRVGELVEDVLATFSTDDLVRFVEDKSERDLQWIRINGSVVGGVVGLGSYLFVEWVYLPLWAGFFSR
ncbi:DUF445 domain-containing protein [Heliophilum fasciatum]|uniref:Uncharacterized membrane-anchored protein YjiN (DUF445 family) n=1 Tax=Heliophilum fasciatum TaxID=35700 RepID=A0A4R2RZD8_9FIRM|nr:DUF445 domain-containing protein [Heliophilum fasciatum]MCW2276995.1 uncharacterized membrane-anchored protein YjiN (DUF445 family) [Heliophilum fasciatum]TCP68479.1 uncharacterized membrane-anchored protein YjiN (DUF445 family) [Heliophilum fasciatum]